MVIRANHTLQFSSNQALAKPNRIRHDYTVPMIREEYIEYMAIEYSAKTLNFHSGASTEPVEELDGLIADVMDYHEWDDNQKQAGAFVKNAIATALKVILVGVPPCPDRSAAIRKLREARMDCNSAITHKGKY